MNSQIVEWPKDFLLALVTKPEEISPYTTASARYCYNLGSQDDIGQFIGYCSGIISWELLDEIVWGRDVFPKGSQIKGPDA